MGSFLGAVNSHIAQWLKWAYLMKPLSDESGKKTFSWTPEMDSALKS